jgi:TPR repeat protein
MGVVFSPYRCMACDKRFFRMSRRFETVLGFTLLSLLGVVALGVTFYVIRMDTPFGLAAARRPVTANSTAPANAKNPPGSANDLEKMPHARAAAAGDAQAQYELGMQYLAGDVTGVKNPVQALKWLEMAAKQGHADARFNLGVMYRAGQGALQNFEAAFQWFELAAMQNHAEAQYNVGLMHKSGMSVPIDPVKAYTWVNLAAAQGHVGAISARDSLLQSMTPQQVVEGQRASRDWKPVAADASQADKPAENAKAMPVVSEKK